MSRLTTQQAIDIALQKQRAGDARGAAEIYRQVIDQHPKHPDALHLLALLHFQAGDGDGAEALMRRAVEAAPNTAEFRNNLGVICQLRGKTNDAGEQFDIAVRLRPNYADALSNLGSILGDNGRLEESIGLTQRAIAIRPDFVDALNNLGNAYMRQGRAAEAIQAYQRAIAVNPDFARGHSNLLLTRHYLMDRPPHALFDEHAAWGKRLVELAGPQAAHENDRSPHRRLRIGYVSADFRGHSVAHLIYPAIACHDRETFEIFTYSDAAVPDAMTERLRRHINIWRPIAGFPDQRVIELIRGDKIDILVDLSGHTAANRLGIFAAKPVPVQVTYLGYPDTTGLPTIDYRITDSRADPPGTSDALNVERLVRIDPCAWCYSAPDNSPQVVPTPALANGFVTFGSFNASAKITGNMVALWSKIVLAVPGSRMLVKATAFVDAGTRGRVQQLFIDHGLPADRFDLLEPVAESTDHLAAYGRVDIALDTFPYNGTATTCESLWMGVPVVTLSGDAHASRVGSSLLTAAGLSELVATTPQQYTQTAITLAADIAALSRRRSAAREQLMQSVLMDATNFTNRLEGAFRKMWVSWCDAGRR